MVSLPFLRACRDYAILPPEVAILGEMSGFPPTVGEIWLFPLKWCHFGRKWCFGGPGAQTPTKPIGFTGGLSCFRVQKLVFCEILFFETNIFHKHKNKSKGIKHIELVNTI